MSVARVTSDVQVTSHVLQRFIQRVGWTGATTAEIQYRFKRGIQVELRGRRYSEARLSQAEGTTFVLLRCDTHITTLLLAPREDVSFVHERPDLRCRSCGESRDGARNNAPCRCGGTDWEVIE